jgi:hypothetical protein
MTGETTETKPTVSLRKEDDFAGGRNHAETIPFSENRNHVETVMKPHRNQAEPSTETTETSL